MPSTETGHQWLPSQSNADYERWNLPAHGWSGADYCEDGIILIHDVKDGTWNARTEVDQCTRRDLDDDEVASIRAEFKIEGRS